MVNHVSQLSAEDIYLFHEGSNFSSYQLMGTHVVHESGSSGVRFTVWAPNALGVRVVGDFNGWQGGEHVMERVPSSGIWLLFVPKLAPGVIYKYEILTASGERILKADPYAVYAQLRPDTASIVYELDGYQWQDEKWQQAKKPPAYQSPVIIYEVHLGSWRRGTTMSFWPIVNWQNYCLSMQLGWGILILKSCRLPNILLTGRGVIKPQGIMLLPAVMVRQKTLCILLISVMSRALVSLWIGYQGIFVKMTMDSGALMVPPFMSMPVWSVGRIRAGVQLILIWGVRKCSVFSYLMPYFG